MCYLQTPDSFSLDFFGVLRDIENADIPTFGRENHTLYILIPNRRLSLKHQHINSDEMRSKQLNNWLPRINIHQWHPRKYSYLSIDCMRKQYEVAGVSVIGITEDFYK